jgi:RNA polymerase sigma-70 factor, ECF subfamily
MQPQTADPDGEFGDRIAPFRKELLAHCYRMTGSLSDAEDAMQDALVRAWRHLGRFEGRSSLRTWLYRVATNACLDLLAGRRARTLPHLVTAEDAEPSWLEPFPDSAIEDDPDTRPDAVYARREATRLAFVAALQRLPARQRAMLILRDVVALSSDEAAAALDVSVATANSLLQRARDELGADAHRRPTRATGAARDDLLARFLRAWESGDPAQLIAVLRKDAITTMPPAPLWLSGRDAIADFVIAQVWPHGPLRLVPTRANDAPAFAVYLPHGFGWLMVVELDADSVSAFHSFRAIDPARYTAPLDAPPP